MQPTKTLRVLLVVAGLVAFSVGVPILLDPAGFHAVNGIELGDAASLLSEVRAPGGALALLGALMLLGAFVRSFAFTSTSIGAAVYLAYGASRLVGLALDGRPADGLVVAAGIELVLGGALGLALLRAARRRGGEGVDVVPARAGEAV